MPTQYRIYGNDGSGGPIDYAAPLATVAGLEWSSPALAHPGDWRFGVRASDTASGLEESNVDASVRLVLDAAGSDITGRPAPVVGLAVTALAGGLLRTTWSPALAMSPRPAGYRVWCQAGTSVNFALAPDAVVPFDGSAAVFAVTLGPLPSGVAHTVAARAFAGPLDDGAVGVVTAMPDGDGPMPVDAIDAALA